MNTMKLNAFVQKEQRKAFTNMADPADGVTIYESYCAPIQSGDWSLMGDSEDYEDSEGETDDETEYEEITVAESTAPTPDKERLDTVLQHAEYDEITVTEEQTVEMPQPKQLPEKSIAASTIDEQAPEQTSVASKKEQNPLAKYRIRDDIVVPKEKSALDKYRTQEFSRRENKNLAQYQVRDNFIHEEETVIEETVYDEITVLEEPISQKFVVSTHAHQTQRSPVYSSLQKAPAPKLFEKATLSKYRISDIPKLKDKSTLSKYAADLLQTLYEDVTVANTTKNDEITVAGQKPTTKEAVVEDKARCNHAANTLLECQQQNFQDSQNDGGTTNLRTDHDESIYEEITVYDDTTENKGADLFLTGLSSVRSELTADNKYHRQRLEQPTLAEISFISDMAVAARASQPRHVNAPIWVPFIFLDDDDDALSEITLPANMPEPLVIVQAESAVFLPRTPPQLVNAVSASLLEHPVSEEQQASLSASIQQKASSASSPILTAGKKTKMSTRTPVHKRALLEHSSAAKTLTPNRQHAIQSLPSQKKPSFDQKTPKSKRQLVRKTPHDTNSALSLPQAPLDPPSTPKFMRASLSTKASQKHQSAAPVNIKQLRSLHFGMECFADALLKEMGRPLPARIVDLKRQRRALLIEITRPMPSRRASLVWKHSALLKEIVKPRPVGQASLVRHTRARKTKPITDIEAAWIAKQQRLAFPMACFVEVFLNLESLSNAPDQMTKKDEAQRRPKSPLRTFSAAVSLPGKSARSMLLKKGKTESSRSFKSSFPGIVNADKAARRRPQRRKSLPLSGSLPLPGFLQQQEKQPRFPRIRRASLTASSDLTNASDREGGGWKKLATFLRSQPPETPYVSV